MESGTKKAKPTERRKHPRLPLSIPIFVRGNDGNGKELLEFATALNVGAGGILLATRHALPLSAEFSLEIPVAPFPASDAIPESVRTLKARIVRAMHMEKYHLAGLKFLKPLKSI